MDQEKLEHLVTKIDGFVQSLESDEQAMFASLVADADDVSGFSPFVSIVWGHFQVPRTEDTPPGQPVRNP